MVKAPVFEIGMRGFEPHTPCQNIAVRVGSPGQARTPEETVRFRREWYPRFDSWRSSQMSMSIAERLVACPSMYQRKGCKTLSRYTVRSKV